MSVFSENLKHWRGVRGMTQQQVADQLGVARATYAYYETGRNEPSFKMLVRLSDLFHVSTDALLKEGTPMVEKPETCGLYGVHSVLIGNQWEHSVFTFDTSEKAREWLDESEVYTRRFGEDAASHQLMTKTGACLLAGSKAVEHAEPYKEYKSYIGFMGDLLESEKQREIAEMLGQSKAQPAKKRRTPTPER